jgi:CRISPR-associated protein Csm1
LHNSVVKVCLGSLLHDIGKVLYRAGDLDGRAHSISGAEWVSKYTKDQEIINCIRYHHYQDIKDADLDKRDAAYVVYLADNISAGIDRREIEGESKKGFDRNRPLDSIYNLLNGRKGQEKHPAWPIEKKINYPFLPGEEKKYQASSDYAKILAGMGEVLRGIEFNEKYINSLLEICEAWLSFIPSSTNLSEAADISLFDHAKITAALASAIVLYLESQGRFDYRKELLEKGSDFYEENAFTLLSFDLSGIQQFIYTISSKGALKGLRARSFYLEIILENMADEILQISSLSRANLLYTGGGHAYILMPNTLEVRIGAEQAIASINQRLAEYFGTRLYTAFGIQECSANELMSKTKNPESYSNIFRSVSAQIAEMKLRRYSPAEILKLNDTVTDMEGRECSVCGVSGNLEQRDEEVICSSCAAFTDISGMLIKKDTVFAVLKEKLKAPALPLFSARGDLQYMYALSVEQVKELLLKDAGQVIRVYSKNNFRTGLSLATKIWMGDFAANNPDETWKTFADLAESSAGIKRIGVLRADVDGLGTAFINGFQRKGEENQYRYVTISRTTTLSRSLSVFFKYYINTLIEEGENHLVKKEGEKNLVIVYAGGDDLFLVGAWDEVLSAGINLYRAFKRYTSGALTLSAGFGFFEEGYPLSRMAKETEELEMRAKKNRYAKGEKNSVALFGLEGEKGLPVNRHTYDWETFEYKVLGEKYAQVAVLFDGETGYGGSFLYHILYLLRQTAEDQINLARLAYFLARREPNNMAHPEIKEAYSRFSRNIYQWALKEEDRRQLITALMLYTYSRRDKEEYSDE